MQTRFLPRAIEAEVRAALRAVRAVEVASAVADPARLWLRGGWRPVDVPDREQMSFTDRSLNHFVRAQEN